jgi:RNA polymerase sigma factor (sigma-70 family)
VCTQCPTALARDLDTSFAMLVEHHQDLVFGVARRLVRNSSDAEDLAQDTFVRAYRALRTWPAERIAALQVRGWLARICLNLVRNRARDLAARGGPQVDLEKAVEPADSLRPGPEAAFERRESARHWSRLLDELPHRYATAVALRHVDGLSYPELAEALDRPVNTVKSDVHRGVALLREAFEREEREGRNQLAAAGVVGAVQ